MRDQELEQLWSGIGLVPRAAFLFSGTVASNLRFGMPDATEAELWRALDIAQAADFVAAMPGELDASIDQGGTNVSGSLVAGPKILGNATNVLFDGVVGKRFPASVTKAQAAALLRAHGQGQLAGMLVGMNITPGVGVDITRLGRILGVAALAYLLGALDAAFVEHLVNQGRPENRALGRP